MNVVLISDERYVFLLGGCLYSLLKSNRKVDSIDIYIVADAISAVSQKKVKEIGESFNRRIIFLNPPVMNNNLIVKGSLSISTYYRLMLSSIIPDSIDKLIYLDCDVFVRDCLLDLWNEDVSDFFLAGVYDTTGKFARESVGLSSEDIYVNAGILLINLKKWRESRIEDCFVDFLKEKKWSVEFNDQGVINHVCSSNIKLVPPKFNFMYPYERYSYSQLQILVEKKEFYKEEAIEVAKKNPVIIHFAGYAFSRPWFEGVKIKYGDEFLDCIKQSGFSFSRFSQPTSLRYRIRRIINKFPNYICLFVNKIIDGLYVLSITWFK